CHAASGARALPAARHRACSHDPTAMHARRARRQPLLVLLVTAGLGDTAAVAGRTYDAWSYGTEVEPERCVELMSSLYEEIRQPGAAEASETRWWLGPLVGVTDQLELALPVEFVRDRTASGETQLARYGAELRYRMVTPDPVAAPPIVPLVRVALYRMLDARDTVNPEADLVV